jgi:predicted dehydrogenase
MSDKKIKVGVVGGGAIAQACHIPGYAANPDFELTAIADPCAGSLEQVRSKWAFKKEYADYREMIETEKPDVVSVCTPNKFHAEIAIFALEHGADIVLEKPIGLSIVEGEAIRAAALRNNKRIFVCFSHRFNDMIAAARKALNEGKIGEPYMFRVRFAHGGPWPGWAKTDWFYNPEIAGGGALLDMAVHAFDLIRHLIGEVTAVSAKAATLRKDIKLDDNIVALLEVGDRCMGYVDAGWTSRGGFAGIEIMGDNGYITAHYGKGTVTATYGITSPDGTIKMNEEVLLDGGSRPHWTNQMAAFTRSIADGSVPSPGIADGLEALKITLACYQSSREGKRITIQ